MSIVLCTKHLHWRSSISVSVTPTTSHAAVVWEHSSVSVDIMRPDWLNTHIPPASIMRNVSPIFLNGGWQCCVFLVHKVEGVYRLRKLKTSSPINENVMERVPRSKLNRITYFLDSPIEGLTSLLKYLSPVQINRLC